MTPTPVGMRCPECSRQRTKVRTLRDDVERAARRRSRSSPSASLVFLADGQPRRRARRGGNALFRDLALDGPDVAGGDVLAAGHRRLPARRACSTSPSTCTCCGSSGRCSSRRSGTCASSRSTSRRCWRARSARSLRRARRAHRRRLGRGLRPDGRGRGRPARARHQPAADRHRAARSSSTSASRFVLPNISIGGHIGGLIGGALVGLVVPGRRPPAPAAGARLAGCVGAGRRRGGRRARRSPSGAGASPSGRRRGERARRAPARRRAGAATRSGCRTWASSSRPSTSRGPGREK